MCPFRFRVSSFLDSFRVKRSVGSFLSTWYDRELSRTDISVYVSFQDYASANFISRKDNDGVVLSCCSFVMFGVGPWLCLLKNAVAVLLSLPARSASGGLTAY